MSKAILKLPMNIESCSKNQQMALRLLRQHADGLKASELLKLMRENVKWNVPAGSIGSLFNRLESFGFVEHSSKLGAAWKLSELGKNLFNDKEVINTVNNTSMDNEAVEIVENLALERPIEKINKKQDAVPPLVSIDPPLVNHLELTLQKLEQRLQPLPAESVQTYLRIVRLLPAYLVEILEPITKAVTND